MKLSEKYPYREVVDQIIALFKLMWNLGKTKKKLLELKNPQE